MPKDTQRPLSTAELLELEQSRDWIKGHFSEHVAEKYQAVTSKLRLIQTILDSNWIASDETWKLQALGVTFGDALAQDLMLEWIAVDDEYGQAIGLSWPGTSITCFPLTMISKRVEDREDVDVEDLFSGTKQRLSELAFQAIAV